MLAELRAIIARKNQPLLSLVYLSNDKKVCMQDKPAAYCQYCTDQELAAVHIIHWAQNPTLSVNIHHGHFTVHMASAPPSSPGNKCLYGKENLHAMYTPLSMTKASKTTSISLQLSEWPVDLPQTYSSNSAVLLLSQAHYSKLAGCGRVVSTWPSPCYGCNTK